MNETELKNFITDEYYKTVEFIKEHYDEDLSHIKLEFDQVHDKKFGDCSFTNEIITFYIYGDKYDTYTNMNKFTRESIVHELAHAICHKYKICNSFWEDYHNISFGIVCYCLQREILGKNEGFYRKYDMGEEFHLKYVNKKKLDGLINHIKYNTVKELSEKALHYADYVRKNILNTMTYKQWEEV